MWIANAQKLQMTEGDWGIELPIQIDGATFTASDEVRFTLKTKPNGGTLLTKSFTDISRNTVKLMLTEGESNALKAGVYVYTLDWYQDGAFLCNIIPSAVFKVVDKA